MDIETTGILAILSLILSVVSNMIHAINHTKIRSSCMGKKFEASLDISRIENPTP
jgi:hypothetical protein